MERKTRVVDFPLAPSPVKTGRGTTGAAPIGMSRRTLLAGALSAPLVATAQSGGGRSDIKIGWQPAAFFELFLAKQDGLFEKARLNPTFVKFLSGPAMFSALKNGDVDVTFGGMPPFLYALAQGLETSIFYWSFTTNPSLVVRPDSGIRSYADLKGKKIATVMGSSAHYNLMQVLADTKISPSQVEVLNMQLSSLVPAFSKGDIPAALIWEPWGVKLTQVGGRRVGTYGVFDRYSQTGIYWGRRKWMNENPDSMVKFLSVIDQGLTMVKADPVSAAKALAHETGLDEKETLEVLKDKLQIYVDRFDDPLQRHPLAMTPAGKAQYGGHIEALYEMGEFLHRNGNIPVLLTRDQIAAAHSPQFLERYVMAKVAKR